MFLERERRIALINAVLLYAVTAQTDKNNAENAVNTVKISNSPETYSANGVEVVMDKGWEMDCSDGHTVEIGGKKYIEKAEVVSPQLEHLRSASKNEKDWQTFRKSEHKGTEKWQQQSNKNLPTRSFR